MHFLLRLCAIVCFNLVLITCPKLGDEGPQQGKNCLEYEVYIKRIGECKLKSRLERECEYDEQCLAKTAHTYCGFATQDDEDDPASSTKCLCNPGYFATIDNGEVCLPIQSCSHSGANDEMKQFDCGKNQFCRKNVCLCKANFEFKNNFKNGNYCEYMHDYCPRKEQILIPGMGCFYGAKIGQTCEHTEQCLNLTNNSICAVEVKTKESICQCEDGYELSGQNCEQIVATTTVKPEIVTRETQTTTTSTEISSTSTESIPDEPDEIPESKILEKEGIQSAKKFDLFNSFKEFTELDLNIIVPVFVIALVIAFFVGFGIYFYYNQRRLSYLLEASNSFEMRRKPANVPLIDHKIEMGEDQRDGPLEMLPQSAESDNISSKWSKRSLPATFGTQTRSRQSRQVKKQ